MVRRKCLPSGAKTVNLANALDRIKPAIQEMVRATLADMERLSASNIALTILALVAYQGKKYSQTLERLCEALQEKQLPNGSWNEELWATSLALLAQHRLQQQAGKRLDLKSGRVRQAIGYIESTANERRWNWQGEFFETILLCWVLPTIGYRREDAFIRKAIEAIAAVQAKEGKIFDIYDTSLALLAFKAGADPLGMDTAAVVSRAEAWLKQWPPDQEAVWSKAVLLFAIAEGGLNEPIWAESLVESLLNQFSAGVISDDHDEQAMTILAICEYLSNWHSDQFNLRRIPIDNLVRVLQYEEFLRTSRTSIGAKLEAVNAGPVGDRIFVYSDAFMKHKDELFSALNAPEQFRSMVSAFYVLFYDGSGAAKRIPAELLGPDSVIFKIKHLRNSIQHDLQHGSEPERKERNIEAVYREACGRPRAYDIDDFRLVQVYFLSECERLLLDLGQRLTTRSIADRKPT